MTEPLKIAGDVGAISIVLATITEYLPAASAILSLIYIAIRIYETRTIRKWLGRL
tara:strand:+ start:3686 stop:3850 length:165 start_codon:yes stop_codon:yes gene_type:complete